MAVNYSLTQISTKPGQKDAPKKWYAKMQASGEVTMDEMAEDIAYATTLTDGDVLNALRALLKQLNKHLAAGKIVRLENFGTFQLQLHSEGADTEEEFTTANITGATVQFRPGKTTQATTRAGEGGLTFKRVPKLEDAPAAGGGSDGGNGTTGGDNDDGEDQTENPLA